MQRDNFPPLGRRQFLWELGGGLGGIALAHLLNGDGLLAAGGQPRSGGALERLHHPAKAKRVVQLFMAGGASHLDTFDYKPLLHQRDGEKWDPGEHIELFQDGLGATFCSPWKWRPHGQCGKMLNEIVAPLGSCVDEMAFVHSLVGKTGVHSQGTYLQATGFDRPGFPGAGCVGQFCSWLGERKPADVCRAARPSGLRAPTVRRTGAPAFCPPNTRGRSCVPARAIRSPTCTRRPATTGRRCAVARSNC